MLLVKISMVLTHLTNLESANDDEVPQWAIVLKECFKSILIALKDNNYSAELESLNVEYNSLKQDIKNLKIKTDDIEQRGRNDCLFIHGISESQNEDTNVFVCGVLKDKLGIKLVVLSCKHKHITDR